MPKVTKAQLQLELEHLKGKHAALLKNMDAALREILDDNCYEAVEEVNRFCDLVGIDFPVRRYVIEVPHGISISHLDEYESYDDNAQSFCFDVIEEL